MRHNLKLYYLYFHTIRQHMFTLNGHMRNLLLERYKGWKMWFLSTNPNKRLSSCVSRSLNAFCPPCPVCGFNHNPHMFTLHVTLGWWLHSAADWYTFRPLLSFFSSKIVILNLLKINHSSNVHHNEGTCHSV